MPACQHRQKPMLYKALRHVCVRSNSMLPMGGRSGAPPSSPSPCRQVQPEARCAGIIMFLRIFEPDIVPPHTAPNRCTVSFVGSRYAMTCRRSTTSQAHSIYRSRSRSHSRKVVVTHSSNVCRNLCDGSSRPSGAAGHPSSPC
jgi:hypothetical protein